MEFVPDSDASLAGSFTSDVTTSEKFQEIKKEEEEGDTIELRPIFPPLPVSKGLNWSGNFNRGRAKCFLGRIERV